MARTEISADEALLWLRSYHAETLRIAREGMGAWRNLNECICGALQYHGSLAAAPQSVQDAHLRYAKAVESCRKALDERAAALNAAAA